MKPLLALIAVGLDAAASRFSKSKTKKTEAAVVVGVAGIGVLLAPVGVLSNRIDPGRPLPTPPEPPPPNNAPEVSCLWVSNHGSSGFTVKFDVSTPSGGTIAFERFHLTGSSSDDVDSPYESDYCDWLSIPGFDGVSLLPYPGYLHSFDFKITGQIEYWEGVGSFDVPIFLNYWATEADVSISLYVILDSSGALYSMMTWASDSGGDGYKVPVYYSAGGNSFVTLP